TRLRRDLACYVEWKRELPSFLFAGLQLPDLAAQRIHSGDDATPERGRRARVRDIHRRFQQLDHRYRNRRMNQPVLDWAVFAFRVAILWVARGIVVEQ